MEAQGSDAPSSVDGTGPSVGGTDGGGFSDDAAAANQSVTTAYSTAGVGTGRDTYSQVNAMKGALGITATNPYGYKGFFSKHFGIDPESIDYSMQHSPQEMNVIAGKNIGISANPNNNPSMIGFDPNQPANQPRSGIQSVFGGFGSPVGQMTALGPIAAQRTGKPMDALARSAFGMLASGTLPGLFSAMIGPPESYAVKGSIGYDPAKDPALSGNQSLGTMADIAALGLTGGTTSMGLDAYDAVASLAPDAYAQVKDAVTDAIGSVTPTSVPSVTDKDFSGMMSGRDTSLSGIASLSPAQVEEVRDAFETKTTADTIKDAFETSIKENVSIPSNISFSDLMSATTPGTPEYEATKGGDFSSITYGR